jgi:dihydroorotate dehydrogenase (NAD+) catalytic subunit
MKSSLNKMFEINLCGVKLRNPFILASGILGVGAPLLKRVYSKGAGAVTTKSIGPVERIGNKNPSVIEADNGLMNCVGLPTPGFLNMKDEFEELMASKVPVIYSVYGSSIEDYVKIVEFIQKFKPALIELNISCPNKAEGMLFAQDKDLAYDLVKKVRAVSKIPIIAKLTPNCKDIVEIAIACEKAGADAITAINTVLIKDKDLSMGQGGLSGPAIHSTAIEAVSKIHKAVKIPIIGIGGVNNGKEALDMIKAGATAVGIGSGVYYRGIEIFSEILEELKKELGGKSVEEMIGYDNK